MKKIVLISIVFALFSNLCLASYLLDLDGTNHRIKKIDATMGENGSNSYIVFTLQTDDEENKYWAYKMENMEKSLIFFQTLTSLNVQFICVKANIGNIQIKNLTITNSQYDGTIERAVKICPTLISSKKILIEEE